MEDISRNVPGLPVWRRLTRVETSRLRAVEGPVRKTLVCWAVAAFDFCPRHRACSCNPALLDRGLLAVGLDASSHHRPSSRKPKSEPEISCFYGSLRRIQDFPPFFQEKTGCQENLKSNPSQAGGRCSVARSGQGVAGRVQAGSAACLGIRVRTPKVSQRRVQWRMHRPHAAFSSFACDPGQVGPAHLPGDPSGFCHPAPSICKSQHSLRALVALPLCPAVLPLTAPTICVEQSGWTESHSSDS